MDKLLTRSWCCLNGCGKRKDGGDSGQHLGLMGSSECRLNGMKSKQNGKSQSLIYSEPSAGDRVSWHLYMMVDTARHRTNTFYHDTWLNNYILPGNDSHGEPIGA